MKEKLITQEVKFLDADLTSAEHAVHPGHEAVSKVPETNDSQSPAPFAASSGGPDHARAKSGCSTHASTRHASKYPIERRQLPPTLVPSVDGRKIHISPAFLHGLFAVDPRSKRHPVDDRKTEHQIAATFSTTLLYRGARPDQDVGTVLFGLISREIGQEIGREFSVPLRSFAKSLAWSDSSSSSRRCLRALHLLAEGRLRYRWNDEDDVEIGFIRIHEETATYVTIGFEPSFAWAFTGNQTYLDFQRRTLLQSGLETWLYGVAMSNGCTNPFATHSLHHLAGSTKLLRQFGIDIVAAAAKLVRYGLIQDCYLDHKPIRVARPELFSDDSQPTGVPRTAPVRIDPVTYLKIVKGAKSKPGGARSDKKTTPKTARRSTVSKEPDQPESGFDHEPYSSHEYDDSAPDMDDLPSGDDDE